MNWNLIASFFFLFGGIFLTVGTLLSILHQLGVL